jgi:hypothetical protein
VSRSPRQEFRPSVKAEIKARAYDADAGVYRCEADGCGCVVSIKECPVGDAPEGDVDHTQASWTQSAVAVKDRPPLTADDGKLLCEDCHKDKTRQEAFERKRTDGAGKIYAEHLRVMAAKLEGVELEPTRGKLNGRGFPKTARKLQSRGFPTKAERQAARAGR